VTDTFTAVDLSRLSAPGLIETIPYETVLADLIADFTARMVAAGNGTPTLVETDPAMIVLQTVAYRVVIERQRVNEAAKATMVAFAEGTDLDNLAAVFGVTRLAGELDDALRQRIVLAPESYSVAGPEGAYIHWARSVDATIIDASATSPTPGVVIVSLLSSGGDGSASAGQIAAVTAVVNNNNVRPLTDQVTVQSAAIVTYTLEAELTIFSGPDDTVILAAAQQRANDYVNASARIGRDVVLSSLYAALTVEGVQRVNLISPTADIAISRTQASKCVGQTVRIAGVGE
jgi:phage-related baseplate assembly protein